MIGCHRESPLALPCGCQWIPKVQKRKSSHQCLFALLGFAGIKASRKTLVKTTPDGDAIVLKNCRQIGKFTFR
jgi:hypothetical protein